MDRPKSDVQVPAVPDVRPELLQAHRMDTIGELAPGLAHELNNSLAAITAFSQLADFAEARGIRLLAKPFDLASVGRTVREILAGSQPRG